MFYKDSLNVYRVRPLDKFQWLVHGFGTRSSENFPDHNLATLRQIHSDICIDANGRTGCLDQGDALLSGSPDRLVGVKTADCLPILLVDERIRVVAAVHAGWRGTVQHIVRKTIVALQEKFSTRPEDLHAAIGPGIGKCCYKVGFDVAAQFHSSVLNEIERDRQFKLDLILENRLQLGGLGIPLPHIYTANLCTFCGQEDFYSYRRDKDKAGRMFSVVGIRG